MEKENSGTGIGFCGVLTIVFIVLKLCKIINWSWIWVVSPIWIPLLIIGFIYLFWFIVFKIIK